MIRCFTYWPRIETVALFAVSLFFGFAGKSHGATILNIGNSLTWDTTPSELEGEVYFHIDGGKSLTYINSNPDYIFPRENAVSWQAAMQEHMFDVVTVQPYGTGERYTMADDIAVISGWMNQESHADFVIHTSWYYRWGHVKRYDDPLNSAPLTTETINSEAYFNELLFRLQDEFPGRAIT